MWVQDTPVSPSSPSTFVEYDFDGLQDFSSSSTNNNSSSFSGDLTGLSHNGGALVDDALLAPQFNSTVLAPPVSEDEGDSALSGRSSEINENR